MGPRAVLMCAGDFEPFYISVNAEDGGKIPIGDYLRKEEEKNEDPCDARIFVAVDGGHDYLRRCYTQSKRDFTELSVTEEQEPQ